MTSITSIEARAGEATELSTLFDTVTVFFDDAENAELAEDANLYAGDAAAALESIRTFIESQSSRLRALEGEIERMKRVVKLFF